MTSCARRPLRVLRDHVAGAAGAAGAAPVKSDADGIAMTKDDEITVRGLMAALRDPERQEIRTRFWNECAKFPELLTRLGPDKTVEQHRKILVALSHLRVQ